MSDSVYDKTKPRFNRGDVVRHRASGQCAVVISPLMKCVNPEHSLHIKGFTDECVIEFAGSYRLDCGFDCEDFDYAEELLSGV